MDGKTLNALSSAIFVSRCTLAGEAVDTDDKRIRASGLYPEWTEGKHAKGDIYNADKYIIHVRLSFRCLARTIFFSSRKMRSPLNKIRYRFTLLNKRKLKKLRFLVDGWLNDHDLRLKGDWQIFRIVGKTAKKPLEAPRPPVLEELAHTGHDHLRLQAVVEVIHVS